MKITLEHDATTVAPGGEVRVKVTVLNTTRQAVRPVVHVDGLDGAGTSPVGLGSLPVGAAASTELSLRLPPDAVAGKRRIAVVSNDASGRAPSVVAHVELETAASDQVSIGLSPRELRGRVRDRFRIQLHNHGNETVELDLRAKGEHLGFHIKPTHVTLPPGHNVRARARALATRPAVRRPQRRPFQVTAQGISSPITASGAFVQHPFSPRTLIKIVAVLVLLGLWVGGVGAGMKKLNPGAAPSTTAAAATTSAANGTDGGTGELTVSGGDGSAPVDAKGADAAPADVQDPKAGAGGAQAAAAAAQAPLALVLGSVAGPPDPAGIEVRVERVSLGDMSTAGKAGKVPGDQIARPSGEVLSKQSSRTDEGGRFRFAEGLVVPGLYRITAIRAGFDIVSQVAVLTAERPIVELALVLKPASGLLAGRVIGEDGRSIGDAEITVQSDAVSYTARTASSGDALGTWSITGVAAPMSYVVTAHAVGFAAAVQVVALNGGERRSDLQLTLVRGFGTIRGLVTNRAAGIGALTMTAVGVDGGATRTTTTLTESSLVGRYSFSSLPYGRYSLTVAGAGWLTQTRQVVLSAGELVVDIDDARRSTATVVGRVFQEAADGCAYPGGGVPGEVRAQPCGNVGITVANDSGAWRTTSANGTGEFTVSGVPAGTYTVTFERHGYVPAILPVTLGAGDVIDVSTTPLVLRVPVLGEGGASTRAVARDASDPLTVLALACLHPMVSVTESTATVPVPVPDTTGATALCLAAGSSAAPAVVDAAETTPTDICPVPVGGSVSTLRACFTTAGGLRIDGLSPGGKLIHLQADGFDDALITVQVPLAGVVESGVLMLQPLATLSGLVATGAQIPVAGARVFVAPKDPRKLIAHPPATTDGGWFACSADIDGTGAVAGLCVDSAQDGSYRFGRAFGTAEYRIVAPVGAVVESDVIPPESSLDNEILSRVTSMSAGTTSTLDLLLRRQGAIAGIIQAPDLSGENFTFLGDVTVSVTSPSGAPDPRTTVGLVDSPDVGRYRIDRLQNVVPPEGYIVTFTKGGFREVVVYVEGGVGLNAELLRNVVMTQEPLEVGGKVTWRPNPTTDVGAVPIVGASVVVTGITGFRVLDAPPYREAIVASYNATTDGDGLFSRPNNGATFVAGQPSIRVAAAGFAERTVLANLSGQPENTTVEMEPERRTLNGKVSLVPAPPVGTVRPTAEETVVLAGLQVTLRTLDGQIVTGAIDKTTGTFSFSSMRPDIRTGAYVITVSGSGISPTSQEATLAAGGLDDVVEFPDVNIGRRGRLTVTVPTVSDGSLAGATVEVRRANTTFGTGALVRSGVTCPSPSAPGGIIGCALGTVTFDDLELGVYDVTSSLTGWFVTGGSTADLTGQPVGSVSVPAMQRYGRATVTVTGAVDSADPSPIPVVSARVELVAVLPVGNTAVAATAFTGQNGSVVVEGTLPAAEYSVVVTAAGYNPPAVAPRVTVTNGGLATSPIVRMIAKTGSITGSVWDKVPNVVLVGGKVTITGVATTTVNADTGSYTLSGLAPKTYTVIFSNADGTSTQTQVVTVRSDASIVVDQIMLRPAGTLFGTVNGRTSADTTNAVALEGAVVTSRAPDGNDTSVTIAAAGDFTFSNGETGSYRLTTTKAGYVTDVRTVSVSPSSSTFVSIVLVPAARSVTFTVRSSTSTNLGGVDVEAWRASDPTASLLTGTTSSSGASTGKLTLSLDPGAWTVRTTNATGLSDPHANAAGQTFTVVVGAGAAPGVTVTLDRYEQLTIAVTARDNAADAAADLEGATVTVTPPGGTAITLTGIGNGNYRTRAPLTGALSISASKTAYATVTTTVTAVADGSATGAVELSAASRTVTVTVLSSGSGNPILQGVTVTASGVDSLTVASAPTGALGTTTLALIPGTWTLTTTDGPSALLSSGVAAPHGDNTGSITVTVGTTGLTTSISLAPAVGASGTVQSIFTGASTVDLDGATIRATRNGKTVEATSASDGTYTLNLSPSRTWSITVSAVGHDPETTSVTTGAGATTIPLISLTRLGVTLSGKVTVGTASGGVEGVKVTYRRLGESTGTLKTTGSTGTYTATGLDPFATWEVTFDATAATVVANRRQPVTFLVSPTTGGTTVTLNLNLSAAAGTITVQVRGAVPGLSTTAPIVADATVTLRDTAGIQRFDPLTATASASVAPIGNVPFPMIPNNTTNSYQVSVTAPGYGDDSGNDVPVVVTIPSFTVAASTVTVKLYPLPRTLNVTVKDAGDAAVLGATVTLSDGGLGSGTIQATTDGDGVAALVEVPVLPSGAGAGYRMTVAKTGYSSVPLAGIFVAPGASAATLDVRFRRITVTVEGDAGGATGVAVSGSAVGSLIGTTPTPPLTATTGGAFEVEGVLPMGTWSLSVTAPGYIDKSSSVVVVGATYTYTNTIALSPKPTTVAVRSSAGNAALGLVNVEATATGLPTVTAVAGSAAGTYSLALVPGSWSLATTNGGSLSVKHANVTGTALTVPLAANAAIPTLTLERLETVLLHVKGKDSTATASSSAVAVSGATVTMRLGTGNPVTLAATSTAGDYAVAADLPAGSYTFTIVKAGYVGSTSETVSMTVDGDSTGTVTLVAVAQPVSVTVTDASPPPPNSDVANATVEATRSGEPTVSGTTSATGSAAVLNLTPGEWIITVTSTHSGLVTGTTTKTVVFNTPTTATVTMTAAPPPPSTTTTTTTVAPATTTTTTTTAPPTTTTGV